VIIKVGENMIKQELTEKSLE